MRGERESTSDEWVLNPSAEWRLSWARFLPADETARGEGVGTPAT